MTKEPFRDWRWNQHMHRTIDEALSEVEREAHIRLKCFDKWVAEGRLSWVDAFDRLERLLSAVKHLRDMQTAAKMEELSNTGPEVNTDHTLVSSWAHQAKQHIDNPPQSDSLIPFTAPEATSLEARRQNTA